MPRALLVNNAATTIATTALTTSATTITLTDGSKFPSPSSQYFYATLLDSGGVVEIVKCTSRASNVLTVVRAQEGTGTLANTTGYAFAVGSKVSLNITAAVLAELAPLTGEGTSGSWGINAATADLAGKSINLAGGLAGQIPYQTAVDTTALLAAGTLGQVLLSGGAAPPTWGSAVANLAGGLVGQIPYQAGANTTAFLAAGTAGQMMLSGGGAAPTWGSALPADAVINTFAVGYRDVPQNSQSVAYTLVLGDAGKHIYHPSADTTARIWTIPANASVAYPIGTAITFVNDTSGGVITIAITTDVMVLALTGATGSRTLAANGIATALKITATRWMISGSGLT